MEVSNVYIVYSVDKDKWGQALYPDDPKVIENVCSGYFTAIDIVDYLREQDNSRLYGIECWEVFHSIKDYIKYESEEE